MAFCGSPLSTCRVGHEARPCSVCWSAVVCGWCFAPGQRSRTAFGSVFCDADACAPNPVACLVVFASGDGAFCSLWLWVCSGYADGACCVSGIVQRGDASLSLFVSWRWARGSVSPCRAASDSFLSASSGGFAVAEVASLAAVVS